MPTVTNDDTGAVTPANAPLPLVNGGTGSDLSVTGGTHQVLRQSSAGANVTVSQLATSDLSDFGIWTPYSPTLTAATGTWTGGTISISSMKVGKSLWLRVACHGFTLSNSTTNISFILPSGLVAANEASGPCALISNGTAATGSWFIASGDTHLFFDVSASAYATTVNWAASAGNAALHCMVGPLETTT